MSSGGEIAGLPIHENHSDRPGVAQHALVLGFSHNVQLNPIEPALPAQSAHTIINSISWIASQRQTQRTEGDPLLEPLPDVAPADKGSF